VARALDNRDRRILELLRADAWLTYPALGEKVSLSASAVQRRVERLIRDGAILGARAELRPADTAERLIVYLLAELVDDSAETITRLSRTLSDLPEVIEAYYVAGEADLALKLEFADVAAYNAFLERHINGSAAVVRFKTLVALRSLKPAFAQPGERK
jgi:DNA-binding Lrp family transcriptional regulator